MNTIISIFKKYACLFTIAMAIVYPSTAFGVQVIWTLDNVSFDDGGTASGYFVSDTDMPHGEYFIIDWEITVSGGNETIFPRNAIALHNLGKITKNPGNSMKFPGYRPYPYPRGSRQSQGFRIYFRRIPLDYARFFQTLDALRDARRR